MGRQIKGKKANTTKEAPTYPMVNRLLLRFNDLAMAMIPSVSILLFSKLECPMDAMVAWWEQKRM